MENGEDDKESREDAWVMNKRVFNRGIEVKNCDKHKETNDVGDRANKKEGYEERKGRLLWKEVTLEGEQYVKAITEEHAKELLLWVTKGRKSYRGRHSKGEGRW